MVIIYTDSYTGLDLPFYGLGMNSPHIISTIWYGKSAPPTNIYELIVHNVWQSLVVVSLGACVGVAITFVAIDKLGRRNIQIIGFFWLFILFIVIGGSFNHLYEIGGNAAIIVLYILCQIFFNFGMFISLSANFHFADISRSKCDNLHSSSSLLFLFYYIISPAF